MSAKQHKTITAICCNVRLEKRKQTLCIKKVVKKAKVRVETLIIYFVVRCRCACRAYCCTSDPLSTAIHTSPMFCNYFPHITCARPEGRVTLGVCGSVPQISSFFFFYPKHIFIFLSLCQPTSIHLRFFLIFMNICWAPHLKINPKCFTMATIVLVSASEQNTAL